MSVPHILQYINQRLAVEKAREELKKANIDADAMISFQPDPIGEEAIMVLKQLQDTIAVNKQLTFDVEAEKRNVLYLQGQMTSMRQLHDAGT